MNTDPIVVVTGLPRSGTSLMMQMLRAGGMDIVCDPGREMSGECMETTRPEIDPGWLAGCRGKAIKVLEPYHHRLPEEGFRYVFIVMTRDLREQAKSHIKFIRTIGEEPPQWRDIPYPRLVKGGRNVLYRDQVRMKKAVDGFLRKRMPRCSFSFESLLAEPGVIALGLAQTLSWCMPNLQKMDPKAMAAVVRPRGPECLPGMLELELGERERKEE